MIVFVFNYKLTKSFLSENLEKCVSGWIVRISVRNMQSSSILHPNCDVEYYQNTFFHHDVQEANSDAELRYLIYLQFCTEGDAGWEVHKASTSTVKTFYYFIRFS